MLCFFKSKLSNTNKANASTPDPGCHPAYSIYLADRRSYPPPPPSMTIWQCYCDGSWPLMCCHKRRYCCTHRDRLHGVIKQDGNLVCGGQEDLCAFGTKRYYPTHSLPFRHQTTNTIVIRLDDGRKIWDIQVQLVADKSARDNPCSSACASSIIILPSLMSSNWLPLAFDRLHSPP